MQSFITCQMRATPERRVAGAPPRATSLSRFIWAMVLPEVSAISSISAADLNG